jgi:hypothetical protein
MLDGFRKCSTHPTKYKLQNCALLDAAVLRDLKENAERGHAECCGSYRQKNVQRRLCAAQPILPGFEIPRGPIRAVMADCRRALRGRPTRDKISCSATTTKMNPLTMTSK